MGLHILFLLVLIISFSNVQAVIIKGTEHIHPKKNIRIYLLGDRHENEFIYSSPQQLSKFSPDLVASIKEDHIEHSRVLTSFAQQLLHSKENTAFIITETPQLILKHLVYDTQKALTNTVLQSLPYNFLQQVTHGAANPKERLRYFNKSLIKTDPKKNNWEPTYIPFNNGNIHWIAGDRYRCSNLSIFFSHRDEIRLALKENKPLPPGMDPLNLDFLQKYILHWKEKFQEHQFNDAYGDALLAVIDKALASGFSKSNHLVSFLDAPQAKRIRKKDQTVIHSSTALPQRIKYFTGQIFDLELEQYVNQIDTSDEKNVLVICAGGFHTRHLQKYLQKKGYLNKTIISSNYLLNPSCSNEKRKTFNSNLEQFLSNILYQSRVTKQSYTPIAYTAYEPLRLKSDNSKAKAKSGASILL